MQIECGEEKIDAGGTYKKFGLSRPARSVEGRSKKKEGLQAIGSRLEQEEVGRIGEGRVQSSWCGLQGETNQGRMGGRGSRWGNLKEENDFGGWTSTGTGEVLSGGSLRWGKSSHFRKKIFLEQPGGWEKKGFRKRWTLPLYTNEGCVNLLYP